MHTHLLSELRQLLRDVELAQAEQLQLLAQKRTALRESRPDALLELSAREEPLMERTRELLTRRLRLLRQAADVLGPVDSLNVLADRVCGAETERVQARIRRVRDVSAAIQRENRAQWIVARSAFHACTGVLDLIANQGRSAPIYGKGTSMRSGLLLDATV